MQSILLKNSILEKELLLLRQKVQLKKPTTSTQMSNNNPLPLNAVCDNLLAPPPMSLESSKLRSRSIKQESTLYKSQNTENQSSPHSGFYGS